MNKRIFAVLLWFYTGWYAGAMMAEFFGVSVIVGPVIGAAAAGFVGLDPRRIVWSRSSAARMQVRPGAD